MATALNPRLRDGIAAAKARDFERARTLLESVTASSPQEALAWFWLAIVAPSAEAAIPYLRHVVEIDATHEQAREALARLLVTQASTAAAAGNRKEARACATEATELMPNDDAAWLALASVSDDRGERLAALRSAFAANPQAATRTRLKRTILYYAVTAADNDRAEARSLFREAAALEPSDGHVWQALVQLADTPAEALSVVREFAVAAPGDQEARALLKKALAADARALQAAGDTATACQRWREAVEADPRDIEAWLALSDCATEDDEIRRALDAAFEIDPSDERVGAGYARIKPLDPAAFEAPPDAFARLQGGSNAFAGFDATPDPFAQFDLSTDPFARFQPARPKAPQVEEPAPLPVVEAPAAAEEPSIDVSLDVPPDEVAPLEVEAPALPSEVRVAPIEIEQVPIVETPRMSAPWVAGQPETGAAPRERADAAVVAPPAIEEPPAPAPIPEPAVHVPVAPVAAAVPDAPAPVVVPTAPARPAAAAPSAPVRVPGSNGRRTVMVVDDSPTIRKILGLTLERAGYKVVAEPDGESAIERLIHIVPDVILLDISMPKLDGYEVCRRIRKDPRTANVPVVMLSGKDALFDKVKGHMAGASEYLTKPFEPPAVLAAVSHACEAASGVVDG